MIRSYFPLPKMRYEKRKKEVGDDLVSDNVESLKC